MKNFILFALCIGAASVFAKNSDTSGVLEIRPGRKLYVEHYVAAPGRPTVYLLNGLTYSTKQYEDYIRAMRQMDPGIGIVAYDMIGMGRTLLQDPSSNKNRIPALEQVMDLHDLVRTLNVQGPISVAGLSYGGGIELLYSTYFPNDFDHFIGFAPLLERLPDQDLLLDAAVRAHRFTAPGDPRNDDEIYDHYLRLWIYSTYPLAEPIILENPYKLEAIFRMVQGIKNWNAFEVASKYPTRKIHLIAARQDEHVKLRRLDAFWEAIPTHARASYLRLDHSGHKIPEQWPHVTAAWTLHILNKNPHLTQGLIFEGDAYKEVANHGDIQIPLNKAVNCESILRTVPAEK